MKQGQGMEARLLPHSLTSVFEDLRAPARPAIEHADLVQDSSPAPREAQEARDIDTYKRASRAVVFINTMLKTAEHNPLALLLGAPASQVVPGLGSGVIIDAARGIILTNYHVIKDSQETSIEISGDKKYQARVLGADPDRDIAVLQLKDPPPDLVNIPLGDSDQLAVGQRVMAIGNPMGLDHTLTTGIISAPPRTVRTGPDGPTLRGLIQIDAAINPGNSGGALLDSAGRLIGINNMIVSASGGSQGLGFAIPVNTALRIAHEILDTGRLTKAYTGMYLANTDLGPVIDRIDPGSPADKAGLREPREVVKRNRLGSRNELDRSSISIIKAVNGENVLCAEDIIAILAEVQEGQTISLSIAQGDPRARTCEVELKPERRVQARAGES